MKRDIFDKKWISQTMVNELSKEQYFKSIDENLFHQVQRKNDESLRLNIQYEQVNREIRKELHLKYLTEYIDVINNVTNEKCQQINDKLNQVFLKAVCGDTRGNNEILDKCTSFISNVTEDVLKHTDGFHYLIERFSRDLFDIMLNSPIASNDRLQRYETSRYDMFHLDYYYSKGKGSLMNLLLTQKQEQIDTDYANDMLSIARRLYQMSDRHRQELEDIINTLEETTIPVWMIANYMERYIRILSRKIKFSNSVYDVVNEINQDLINLRQVLITAVVPAIDLEVAFLNGVDKQIKLILSAMNNENNYSQAFDRFIAEIVVLVKKQELDNISQVIEQQKLKKELIDKIALI